MVDESYCPQTAQKKSRAAPHIGGAAGLRGCVASARITNRGSGTVTPRQAPTRHLGVYGLRVIARVQVRKLEDIPAEKNPLDNIYEHGVSLLSLRNSSPFELIIAWDHPEFRLLKECQSDVLQNVQPKNVEQRIAHHDVL